MSIAIAAIAIAASGRKHTLAGLHDQRQLGVDAVGILLALLLRGHCVGIGRLATTKIDDAG